MIDSVCCLLLTGAQAFSSLPSDALPRLPFTCEGHTTSYEGETVTGYTSSYETENGVTTCCDQARANGAICGFEVYGSTCVQYLGTRCTLAPAPRWLSDRTPRTPRASKTVRQSSTGKRIRLSNRMETLTRPLAQNRLPNLMETLTKPLAQAPIVPLPARSRCHCVSQPGVVPR